MQRKRSETAPEPDLIPVAVSEPLGAHPELAGTILARYAVGAVELVPV